MLLFVEHQSSQPLSKAEDCDEVNEILQHPGRQVSGVTTLQLSVPRHSVCVTGQDSPPSPALHPCY